MVLSFLSSLNPNHFHISVLEILHSRIINDYSTVDGLFKGGR